MSLYSSRVSHCLQDFVDFGGSYYSTWLSVFSNFPSRKKLVLGPLIASKVIYVLQL